jgi:hypothetical protein
MKEIKNELYWVIDDELNTRLLIDFHNDLKNELDDELYWEIDDQLDWQLKNEITNNLETLWKR